MIRPEISKDLPCRSILFKVDGQYYCALLYTAVSEDLPRQVVLLEISFDPDSHKPTGSIIGEEHVISAEQWAELNQDPCLWFGAWLSRNYRKVHGHPYRKVAP